MNAPKTGRELPQDLRHLETRNAFQLFTEEAAGWTLAAFLLACFVVDYLTRN